MKLSLTGYSFSMCVQKKYICMYVATEALYLTPSFKQIPCVIVSCEIHLP